MNMDLGVGAGGGRWIIEEGVIGIPLPGVLSLPVPAMKVSVLLCTMPRARSVAAAEIDWANKDMQRLKSSAQEFNSARNVEEWM